MLELWGSVPVPRWHALGTVPGTAVGDKQGRVEMGLDSELVGQIEGVPDDEKWLVNGLWSAGGVGIVGGTPKTGKTWFTLEMAVSVASGSAAFGAFEVPEPGPVVLFPAEDDPRAVRDRVAGIAARKQVGLDELPLHIITESVLSLDEDEDREDLEELIQTTEPALVVLDPLVRLHGGDENYAGHIAELLGFFRSLQREYGCSIMLTHHIAKRRASKGAQLGQALRGSGELHAWGDSNVYLTRGEQGLVRVDLEHRSARAPEPFYVALRTSEDDGTWLELTEEPAEEEELRTVVIKPAARAKASKVSLRTRVLSVLGEVGEPISQSQVRGVVGVRNQKLTELLRELAEEGVVERPDGKRRWQLVQTS